MKMQQQRERRGLITTGLTPRVRLQQRRRLQKQQQMRRRLQKQQQMRRVLPQRTP